MIKGPIVWEALEYEHREKSADWYWAVGIIAISIALISIILGNIIFALVVLVSLFALVVHAKREPMIVRFELNKTGLLIDNEFHPYTSLRSFSVEDNSHHDGESKLFFRSRKLTGPLIVIPIDEVEPHDIRDFLLHMLLEEEHGESAMQRFFEYLGF